MTLTARLIAAAGVLITSIGLALEVDARQFYSPRRYHATRQSLTNRAVSKRLARKKTRKVVKRQAPSGRKKAAPAKR